MLFFLIITLGSYTIAMLFGKIIVDFATWLYTVQALVCYHDVKNYRIMRKKQRYFLKLIVLLFAFCLSSQRAIQAGDDLPQNTKKTTDTVVLSGVHAPHLMRLLCFVALGTFPFLSEKVARAVFGLIVFGCEVILTHSYYKHFSEKIGPVLRNDLCIRYFSLSFLAALGISNSIPDNPYNLACYLWVGAFVLLLGQHAWSNIWEKKTVLTPKDIVDTTRLAFLFSCDAGLFMAVYKYFDPLKEEKNKMFTCFLFLWLSWTFFWENTIPHKEEPSSKKEKHAWLDTILASSGYLQPMRWFYPFVASLFLEQEWRTCILLFSVCLAAREASKKVSITHEPTAFLGTPTPKYIGCYVDLEGLSKDIIQLVFIALFYRYIQGLPTMSFETVLCVLLGVFFGWVIDVCFRSFLAEKYPRGSYDVVVPSLLRITFFSMLCSLLLTSPDGSSFTTYAQTGGECFVFLVLLSFMPQWVYYLCSLLVRNFSGLFDSPPPFTDVKFATHIFLVSMAVGKKGEVAFWTRFLSALSMLGIALLYRLLLNDLGSFRSALTESWLICFAFCEPKYKVLFLVFEILFWCLIRFLNKKFQRMLKVRWFGMTVLLFFALGCTLNWASVQEAHIHIALLYTIVSIVPKILSCFFPVSAKKRPVYGLLPYPDVHHKRYAPKNLKIPQINCSSVFEVARVVVGVMMLFPDTTSLEVHAVAVVGLLVVSFFYYIEKVSDWEKRDLVYLSFFPTINGILYAMILFFGTNTLALSEKTLIVAGFCIEILLAVLFGYTVMNNEQKNAHEEGTSKFRIRVDSVIPLLGLLLSVVVNLSREGLGDGRIATMAFFYAWIFYTTMLNIHLTCPASSTLAKEQEKEVYENKVIGYNTHK